MKIFPFIFSHLPDFCQTCLSYSVSCYTYMYYCKEHSFATNMANKLSYLACSYFCMSLYFSTFNHHEENKLPNV